MAALASPSKGQTLAAPPRALFYLRWAAAVPVGALSLLFLGKGWFLCLALLFLVVRLLCALRVRFPLLVVGLLLFGFAVPLGSVLVLLLRGVVRRGLPRSVCPVVAWCSSRRVFPVLAVVAVVWLSPAFLRAPRGIFAFLLCLVPLPVSAGGCSRGVFLVRLRSSRVPRSLVGSVLLLPGFSLAPVVRRGRRVGFVPVPALPLVAPSCVPFRGFASPACVPSLCRFRGSAGCRLSAPSAPVPPAVPPVPPLGGEAGGLAPSLSGSVLLLSSPSFVSSVRSGACPVGLAFSAFPRWCVRSACVGSLCLAGGAGLFRRVPRSVRLSFLRLALPALGWVGALPPSRSCLPSSVRAFCSRVWAGGVVPPRPWWAGSSAVRFSLPSVVAGFRRLSSSLGWLARSGGGLCPPAVRPLLACLVARVVLSLSCRR